jgi:hypothetical protein
MVFNRHEILDFGPFVPIIGVGRVASHFSPFEESHYWESRQPASNAIDEKPVQVKRPLPGTLAYDTPENVDPEDSFASTLMPLIAALIGASRH